MVGGERKSTSSETVAMSWHGNSINQDVVFINCLVTFELLENS